MISLTPSHLTSHLKNAWYDTRMCVCTYVYVRICLHIYTHACHIERVKVTIIFIYQVLGQLNTNQAVCIHTTESLKHHHYYFNSAQTTLKAGNPRPTLIHKTPFSKSSKGSLDGCSSGVHCLARGPFTLLHKHLACRTAPPLSKTPLKGPFLPLLQPDPPSTKPSHLPVCWVPEGPSPTMLPQRTCLPPSVYPNPIFSSKQVQILPIAEAFPWDLM